MQLPSFANNSGSLGSYTVGDVENDLGSTYIALAPFIAAFLSIIIILTFFPIVQKKIESKNGIKPKAYFQFWASQPLILVLGMWTIVKNSYFNSNGNIDSNNNVHISVFFTLTIVVVIVMTLLLLPFISMLSLFDLNTPTQCCCYCKVFVRVSITFMSLATTTFFSMVFLISIPSIILIYYLHPVQTLARLPFVINSILYINSLGALLLYQLERCSHPCSHPCSAKTEESCDRECEQFKHCLSPFHKERAKVHNEYYREYRECTGEQLPRQCLKYTSCFMQPVATILVLIIVVLFIVILSDLLNMDRSQFTEKNEVELLFTLVPSAALLFGSVYNLDFFFKDVDILERKDKESKPNQATRLLKNTHRVLEESV